MICCACIAFCAVVEISHCRYKYDKIEMQNIIATIVTFGFYRISISRICDLAWETPAKSENIKTGFDIASDLAGVFHNN